MKWPSLHVNPPKLTRIQAVSSTQVVSADLDWVCSNAHHKEDLPTALCLSLHFLLLYVWHFVDAITPLANLSFELSSCHYPVLLSLKRCCLTVYIKVEQTTFTQLAFADPQSQVPISQYRASLFWRLHFNYDYFVISLLSLWSPCLLKAGLRFSESCASGMLQDLRTLLGFFSHEGEDQ